MSSPLRQALATPGGLRLSTVGLVARLPLAMMSLGLVLLVHEQTDSFAVAGLVSGSYLVGSAAGAVVQGRLMDALGQRPVLRATSLATAVLLSGLVWMIKAEAALAWQLALGVLAGSVLPVIGSAVRARWSFLLPPGPAVDAAYAWESVVDEVIFVGGPLLVTALATLIDPVVGLAVAGSLALVGGLTLAADRSTTPPPPQPTRERLPRVPFGARWLVAVGLTGLCLGIVFGALEVSTVAFAEQEEWDFLAGLALASFSLSSLFSGVALSVKPLPGTPQVRLRYLMCALTVSLLPLLVASNAVGLILAMFLAGLTISPCLISGTTYTASSAPAGRLTEAIALFSTGILAGVAPGAAAAGAVVEHASVNAGYLVALGAAAVGIAAASILPRSRENAGLGLSA